MAANDGRNVQSDEAKEAGMHNSYQQQRHPQQRQQHQQQKQLQKQ